MAEITQKITDSDLGVISLNARTSKDKIVFINVTLEIKNIEELRDLMKKVKRIKNVMDVYRVTA